MSEGKRKKPRTVREIIADDFAKMPPADNTQGRSERVELLADLAERLDVAELDNLIWLIARAQHSRARAQKELPL